MGLEIRLICKRCQEDYELIPGYPLSEFCSTCTRFLGRRLQEVSQIGLNQRYAQELEARNQAPWGNPGKNLNRVFSLPRGGR